MRPSTRQQCVDRPKLEARSDEEVRREAQVALSLEASRETRRGLQRPRHGRADRDDTPPVAASRRNRAEGRPGDGDSFGREGVVVGLLDRDRFEGADADGERQVDDRDAACAKVLQDGVAEVQPCGGWNERPRYTFLFYLFVIKMIVPFIFTITV